MTDKKIWHEGSEIPEMYVDPTTGAKWADEHPETRPINQEVSELIDKLTDLMRR